MQDNVYNLTTKKWGINLKLGWGLILELDNWDMVEEETLKRIRKVKLLPENNRRLRYLSKEECQELISNCESNLKPIVIIALNTGMRKGEILNLELRNK